MVCVTSDVQGHKGKARPWCFENRKPEYQRSPVIDPT